MKQASAAVKNIGRQDQKQSHTQHDCKTAGASSGVALPKMSGRITQDGAQPTSDSAESLIGDCAIDVIDIALELKLLVCCMGVQLLSIVLSGGFL